MRKKTLKIYAWVLSLGFIYFVWVKFFDGGLPCLVMLTTGAECGSCGISRMLLGMLSLDFKSAFFYNPVMFVSFFVWNLIGLCCILEKPKFVLKSAFLYTMLAITAAAVMFFGVYRNFY